MSDLLRKLSGSRSQPTKQGTLCDLADDSGAEVFRVLSSETARTIYLSLQDESATSSEIADYAGTSIQNAQYHLTKLLEAELIELIDTEYSSKGSEMHVYSATDDPLIIVSGSDSRLE
ncbi:ArsR/SmtB family transcription factor [Haladaptatus halobius]|uniref:ArsR/SmtB family transcription factor n=1 Tax=Haladaptatus halobius TaxID=2884875 RepID=UPI001D0BDDC9|nr:helix-turn-helix domain-containing protein [Haladaptatus halobius]